MSLKLILGCMYSGKCYKSNTKILDSNLEYRKIDSFWEGDSVYGWDGKHKKILSISSYVMPIYMTKYKGGSFCVSDNHTMVIWDSIGKCIINPKAFEFENMFFNNKGRYSNIVSPILTGVTPDNVDPYLLGFILSAKGKQPKKRKIDSDNINYRLYMKNSNTTTFPEDVKYYSYEGRVDFCNGFLDGSPNHKKIHCKSKSLANGISFIMWSIGLSNTIIFNKNIIGAISYYIQIDADISSITKNDIYVPITGFEKYGTSKVVGIEVEDNHVVLENCVIGHNSSQLIHEMTKYRGVNENIFCINSKKDSRNPDSVIMTHDAITIPCCKVENLYDATIPYRTNVIGIDEAQFFNDLVPFVKEHLKKGIHLVVAGLDGDSSQNKFGNILDLIPLADSYTKQYALCNKCKDGTPGIFTHRIVNDNSQILVGAKDKYISICRKCINKLT